MLVRRIARPLFATWFLVHGVNSFRRPRPHAERAEAAWRRAATRIDLPAPPSPDTVRTLVKVHGAAMATAALMLASGKAPRAAALALAGLTVPVALVDQPFWVPRSASTAPAAEPVRASLRERFVQDVTMVGGALLVAMDRAGRPSLTWRMHHARLGRTAALEARGALTAAKHEGAQTLTAARREAVRAVAGAKKEASAALHHRHGRS